MAKNYKETTTQAAVLRTSTKTLSFWCNIREAPLERFAELIEGNIRIALQDFSGGKGDKSKFAYFNLEISDIYEIKDCMQAKKSFFAQKIYGKHPETGGQFKHKEHDYPFVPFLTVGYFIVYFISKKAGL